jgi:hypothetical protein
MFDFSVYSVHKETQKLNKNGVIIIYYDTDTRETSCDYLQNVRLFDIPKNNKKIIGITYNPLTYDDIINLIRWCENGKISKCV